VRGEAQDIEEPESAPKRSDDGPDDARNFGQTHDPALGRIRLNPFGANSIISESRPRFAVLIVAAFQSNISRRST
jgi:hypothetical protein